MVRLVSRHATRILLLAVAGCNLPVMEQPKPVKLEVGLPPAQVVQRAAQQIVANGLTVVTSDAAGGVLTATLRRAGRGDWGMAFKCVFEDGSINHNSGAATLTLRMTAQASGAGSRVLLAASVHHESNSPLGHFESDTNCASTGVVESAIVEALQRH